MGGWVGLGVGLDAVEKRKILHCRELNPGCQPVTIPTPYIMMAPVKYNFTQ
jgi:hypothetical protein